MGDLAVRRTTDATITSSNSVCRCGRHYGVANPDFGKKINGVLEQGPGWDHYQRAQVYAWYWDRNDNMFGGTAFSHAMREYLFSYVNIHGDVIPEHGGFKHKSIDRLRSEAKARETA